MRLVAFVILMFSMAVVFYFMGFQSPLLSVYSAQGGQNINPASFLQLLGQSILNNAAAAGLLGLAIAATSVAALILSGYSAIYLIPIIFLGAVLNLLVFPISSVLGQCNTTACSTPPELSIPLIVFFNLLWLLTLLGFARGGN